MPGAIVARMTMPVFPPVLGFSSGFPQVPSHLGGIQASSTAGVERRARQRSAGAASRHERRRAIAVTTVFYKVVRRRGLKSLENHASVVVVPQVPFSLEEEASPASAGEWAAVLAPRWAGGGFWDLASNNGSEINGLLGSDATVRPVVTGASALLSCPSRKPSISPHG
eukprot:1189606-Prorocentrum_minimum.AAC.2